jgi:hypothetical protein
LRAIGIIHNNAAEYQRALAYFHAALKLRRERNDLRGLAASYQ